MGWIAGDNLRAASERVRTSHSNPAHLTVAAESRSVTQL